MKAPLIRKHSNEDHGQRGVTMILVAFAMVAIIGMATLSIDVVTLYLARQEAQRAADAAALAAARVLSISGVTGDPNNVGAAWPTICAVATQVAKATARENPISGAPAPSGNISVNFQYNGVSSQGCTFAGGNLVFAMNPQVQVQVVRPGLPTLFSRYWSKASNSVSATAMAEVFNPSNSGSVSPNNSVVPVNPRCVKPMYVPNFDPGGTTFVNLPSGAISNKGINAINGGVIGETFTLFADCSSGANCNPPADNPLTQANILATVSNNTKYNGQPPPSGLNLEYLPGAVAGASVAVPGCTANDVYQHAMAGCDEKTVYECGVARISLKVAANQLDVTENPGGASGFATVGMACSMTNSDAVPTQGMDTLSTAVFPFTMKAGDANPQVPHDTEISSSKSIITIPIYDISPPNAAFIFDAKNQAQVVIVGFLQVFVNSIDANGNMSVTVLNVSGCGNVATNPAVNGTSPVPVRLITPASQ